MQAPTGGRAGYGRAGSGRWPHDLLDATSVAQWSHDWGYRGEFGGQVVHFNRARVVGGCSAHNAGAVVFGSRVDYDGWAAAGNAGWSAGELLPLFAAAWKQLRVRRVGLDELTRSSASAGMRSWRTGSRRWRISTTSTRTQASPPSRRARRWYSGQQRVRVCQPGP